MTSRLPSALRFAFALAGLTLALAAPALAGGGPLITVDTAPKAFDRASEGAAVLVTSLHCGTPKESVITARAEGLIAGERRSLRLNVQSTSRTGTYAVKRTWPAEGQWTLLFSLEDGGHATTAVRLPAAAGGEAVTSYHHRALSAEDVDRLVAGEVKAAKL